MRFRVVCTNKLITAEVILQPRSLKDSAHGMHQLIYESAVSVIIAHESTLVFVYTKEGQRGGKPCFSLSLSLYKIKDGCEFHGKNKNHGLVSACWKQIQLSQARLSPSYFPSESSSLQRVLTRSRYSCFVVCFLSPAQALAPRKRESSVDWLCWKMHEC